MVESRDQGSRIQSVGVGPGKFRETDFSSRPRLELFVHKSPKLGFSVQKCRKLEFAVHLFRCISDIQDQYFRLFWSKITIFRPPCELNFHGMCSDFYVVFLDPLKVGYKNCALRIPAPKMMILKLCVSFFWNKHWVKKMMNSKICGHLLMRKSGQKNFARQN